MCKEAQEIMLLNIDKYSTIVPGVPQKTPQTSVSLSANPTTIPEVCGVFCGTPGSIADNLLPYLTTFVKNCTFVNSASIAEKLLPYITQLV